MLLAFLGEDTVSSRTALRNAVVRLVDEIPGANIVKLDDQNFTVDAAFDALAEGNLFAPKNIVVFDDILLAPEGESFYLKQDLSSEHTVLVRENSTKKALLTRLQQFGDVQVFNSPKKSLGENRAEIFALSKAVVARDRRIAWVEFEKRRRKGDAMEAIHGMLFAAFRGMAAVATLPRAEVLASGVQNFQYEEQSRGVTQYRSEGVLSRFDELKEMNHRAHRGECDLEYEIERFLLQL